MDDLITDEMLNTALDAAPRFELHPRRDHWRVVVMDPLPACPSFVEGDISAKATLRFEDFSTEKDARAFIKWETMRAALAAALPLIRAGVVEECAKVAMNRDVGDGYFIEIREAIAAAIRALKGGEA